VIRVLLMVVFFRRMRRQHPEMFDGALAAAAVNEAIAEATAAEDLLAA
jgi:hypothetical protein